VVDDSITVRTDLLGKLAALGFDAQGAADGPAALGLLRGATARGETVELALLDLQMPGMSGIELAREIRQLNTRIPIAVVTGWGEAVGSNEQKAAGVNWVVAKPFTADRIVELVHEIRRLGSAARPSSFSTVAA